MRTHLFFMPYIQRPVSILIDILIIILVYVFLMRKRNQRRGLVHNQKFSFLLVILGIYFIVVGYIIDLQAIRFTNNECTEVTAQITRIERKNTSRRRRQYYIYVSYEYEDKTIDAKLRSRFRPYLSKGDSLTLYCLNSSPDVVAAVDYEKSIGAFYIICGAVFSTIGLTVVLTTKAKLELPKNGFAATGKIRSKQPVKYLRLKEPEVILECTGTHPTTGLPVSYVTYVQTADVEDLNIGDTIRVYVGKKNPKFYLIDFQIVQKDPDSTVIPYMDMNQELDEYLKNH